MAAGLLALLAAGPAAGGVAWPVAAAGSFGGAPGWPHAASAMDTRKAEVRRNMHHQIPRAFSNRIVPHRRGAIDLDCRYSGVLRAATPGLPLPCRIAVRTLTS